MKLAENLYLNCARVPFRQAQYVEPSVAHILIGDISGSMYDSLPQMRTQLKLKLPTLVGEKDTVSIIVFSGRGQVYLVCEDMPVRTMKDLSALHESIDRFVRPTGLTGFKEPLELAAKVKESIAGQRPDTVFSLFFMSDGFDNQWAKTEILAAAVRLSVESATVVEYGRYADRNLLSQMAATWGAEYVYARDFEYYAPAFEQALSKHVSGAPRVAVDLPHKPLFGVAFAADGQSLFTFAQNDGQVLVPEGVNDVFYLAETGSDKELLPDYALYAALSVFATRMQPKIMYALLRKLGDVAFIRQFQACFGKERYGEFQESAKFAVFDEKHRMALGYDPNAVPRDDVMTVLEVLDLLTHDSEARLLLDHPAFQYKRIGRKRVSAANTLTEPEKAKLRAALEEALEAGDPTALATVRGALDTIERTKVELKFEPWSRPDGYPVRSIKYTSSGRANVTMGITRDGEVDVSALGLTGPLWKNGARMHTHIYRDYAIIKDGMVNVDTLPVTLGSKTLDILVEAIDSGRMPAGAIDTDGDAILLHLSLLPVVNMSMVESASAAKLITLEYRMLKHQAARKVYKHYRDLWYPVDKAADFAQLYGEEDAAKLVAAGITPSGFNPKTTNGEATDVYMAKELKVSLSGLSSLPKVADVEAAVDGKGKMTPPKALMAPAVEQVRKAGQEHTTADDLDMAIATEDEMIHQYMGQIARAKAAIIIGQTWFVEAGDRGMEVEEFTATVDGVEVKAKITQREIEVEI